MQGWIIYKSSANDVKPETYEIKRLMEEAEKQGVNVRVFTPEQFELIVTRDDRKSVMVGGEVLQLARFRAAEDGCGNELFRVGADPPLGAAGGAHV